MIFLRDKHCLLLQLQDHFKDKITDNLLEAKVLVTWSDIPQTEKDQVILAKEMGIKTVVVQHGRNATINYDPEYQDIATGQEKYDFIGDKFLVWGEADRERLLRGGVADEKITIIGCPLIPCVLPDKKNEGAIIFITHHDHSREDARFANEEIHKTLYEKYGGETFAYTIDDKIKTIAKYVMVVSPQMDNEDILKPLEKPFGTMRIDSEERQAWSKMMSALMRAKCVVSPTGGSFEGLAHAMDVPVLRVDVDFGYRDAEGENFTADQKGSKVINLDKLIEEIESLDAADLKEERREIAVNEMGVDYLPSKLIQEIECYL